MAILGPVLMMLLTGCATKEWVRTLMTKERVEVDERVAKAETRTGDRIETLGSRVKGVEDSAQAAHGVATAARERADGAFSKAEGAYATAESAHEKSDAVDARLTRLWNGRHNRATVDTRQVRFGFDEWELNDGAQTALLDVASELKKNPALFVVLEGYTDPRGTPTYNLELSRRRVEAVRRYLVAKGVPLWRINAIGLGIATAAAPDEQKRRVTVTLTLAD
jgi:outer membrane protein OmpA-like peptidoglycan-associated protein